jgi:hypothetical protein
LPFLPLRGLVGEQWSLGKPAHPMDYDAQSSPKVYRSRPEVHKR